MPCRRRSRGTRRCSRAGARGDRRVLDERDRLGIALLGHRQAQRQRPQLPDPRLRGGVGDGQTATPNPRPLQVGLERGQPRRRRRPLAESSINQDRRGIAWRKSRSRDASGFSLVLSSTYLSMTSTAVGPCTRMQRRRRQGVEQAGEFDDERGLVPGQLHEASLASRATPSVPSDPTRSRARSNRESARLCTRSPGRTHRGYSRRPAGGSWGTGGRSPRHARQPAAG